MRRYRFGRIAAFAAVAYLVVILALGVVASATGRIGLVWWPVMREEPLERLTLSWWILLLLGLVAAVQSWAYWQVLRGRVRGESPAADRRVALLRGTLYVSVAFAPVAPLLPWTWWLSGAFYLLYATTVVLYFLVLRGARWLRLAVLCGGMLSVLSWIADTVWFSLDTPGWLSEFTRWHDVTWAAWMVPLLVAQARDPRWSRTTVGMGALSLAMVLLQPSAIMSISSLDEVAIELLIYSLLSAFNVFGLVWQARSAHDLASPPQPASPPPARFSARRWPLPVVAIVPPLLPAAVNLTQGMPFWLGPRGALGRFIREDGSVPMSIAWVAVDLLVGVGAPAVLILIAVLRRTDRFLRVTKLTLIITAAVGVVSVLTTAPGEWALPGPGNQVPIYPDDLFVENGEIVLGGGISPLWYSTALLASALVLMALYAPAPAQRLRHHVLVGGLATAVTLAFLPTSDQARGPVTTAADCEPPEHWETGEPEELTLSPEQKFVCGIRQNRMFSFAATTPDQVLLAHGRRLCGVYTRNDPLELGELAREGLSREALTAPLADICPSAAATAKKAQEADDQEFEAWEADAQRMCDSTPHHRPRITPAKAIRIKEPQWTDHGLLEVYEETGDDYDPADMTLLRKAQDNGLVAARPGHLFVRAHSDFRLCVTLETYTRRPPVETTGWDQVVEVGYESPTGQIVLADMLSGTELPDLSLNGRKGHYRIRVHYDSFAWKGEQGKGQRLLIMAFPAKGDKVITYHQPVERRR
ncbi:hypothetical protein EDD27_4981 [Nonomuraea polychroma]|uniref:Uncharacterized protein n=1 Tax=Nonomuraea polychroma TaxID=46176 RepID=A0A438M9K1_9ACTN|nr:hypothetical protein [Nonomuraea polychroma]RVX42357.1 hypothetical protein EDD27_4981 [Nonomuraea polychroma]